MKRLTLTAFLTASLLDLATTLYAVHQHGTTVEANPLARILLHIHPLLYATTKAIVTTAGAAAIHLAWHHKILRLSMSFATGALCLVAASGLCPFTSHTGVLAMSKRAAEAGL